MACVDTLEPGAPAPSPGRDQSRPVRGQSSEPELSVALKTGLMLPTCHERSDLNELPTAQLLCSLSEVPSLDVGEANAFSPQLLSKGSVLFLPVVDHALLGSIHPAVQNQRDELKREGVHRLNVK